MDGLKKTMKIAGAKVDAGIEALNKRNPREKYMLMAMMGVAFFVVDYFIWIQPVFRVHNEAAPKIAPLREELRQVREDLKNKDAIHAAYDTAKDALTQRSLMFVSADETPALLENLSALAQKTGLKITSLEPLDEKASAKSGYKTVPISLKAGAGTHELGNFLAKLESGATFFRVKDLRVAANASEPKRHTIEIQMEAMRRDKA
jgi:Tfp pilus assembly protein PilO